MPLKTLRDEAPTLNMTPMIDIVFLLIIFFMAGTKFAEIEREIDLQVPHVANLGSLSSVPERKRINIYRDGRVQCDDQTLNMPELTDHLSRARQQYAALGVVVRGDREVVLQHFADVLHACRAAGIEEIGFSCQQRRGGLAA